MSHLHRQVHRLVLGIALAAFIVPAAAADPGREHASAARQLHWQHEDRLYRQQQAAAEARMQARLIALHFRHEEAVERSRQARTATPPAAVARATGSVPWSYALGVFFALAAASALTLAVRRRRRGVGAAYRTTQPQGPART